MGHSTGNRHTITMPRGTNTKYHWVSPDVLAASLIFCPLSPACLLLDVKLNLKETKHDKLKGICLRRGGVGGG